MKLTKITTPEMELALAHYFGYRTNLIVPNVCWGMNIHECDLLIVTAAGYCWECEIKISRADLKNDEKKRHGHLDYRIKRLYFALPDYLAIPDNLAMIPPRAGVIVVQCQKDRAYNPNCKLIRRPKDFKFARKLTDTDRYKVARLGAMRIWRLKDKAISRATQNKYLTACVKSSNNYLRYKDPEKALAVLLRELAKIK
jgi:hypothetical protein